jgi:predicted MFS family arabinose efflux permease
MDSQARSPLAYALAGMVAMAVAMGIGRFVYTPILPGMMDGLGLTASDAGLIASANYAGYLVGAILAAGNWGQGREHAVAMAGLAASTVLAAAMGLTESIGLFLAIRFLAGVASAFVMVFLSTIVFSRLAVAGRSDLQAWHFGGVGAGIAISSLMTAALLLAGAQWQASWLWSGALSALGLAVVWMVIDRGPAPAHKPVAEPPMPRSTSMTRIIVAYGLFGFGYIVTATFLVAIVRQGGADRMFESVVWLATGLAGLPSVWLWGFAARRWGLSKVFAVGCVVEALGVAASVVLGGYVGPLLGGVLLGATFIAVTAMGLQLARQLAGNAPRRVLALMTASFGLGQILGPIVAGIVADSTGSFTAPSLLAALVLLAAAVVGRGAKA